MNYIVLELFPSPFIVCDEEGQPRIISKIEAIHLARECQRGVVVPLDVDILTLLQETSSYIDYLKTKLNLPGEDNTIESRLIRATQ